jgi:hypothetical protein
MSLHTPRIKFPGFILLARLLRSYASSQTNAPSHQRSPHEIDIRALTKAGAFRQPMRFRSSAPRRRAITSPVIPLARPRAPKRPDPQVIAVPRSRRFSLFRPYCRVCSRLAFPQPTQTVKQKCSLYPRKRRKACSRLEMKVDLLRTLIGFSFWNIVPTCGSHRNRGASSLRISICRKIALLWLITIWMRCDDC